MKIINHILVLHLKTLYSLMNDEHLRACRLTGTGNQVTLPKLHSLNSSCVVKGSLND